MSRRPDPARIDEARRAGNRNRLMGEGVTEETADAWIAAWEAEAARRGLKRGQEFWQAGWGWIAAERRRRAKP
jgi:hypothetical protein